LEEENRVWVLCRLVFGSVVYRIWQARNEIRFHGHPKSEEQILKLIFWEIRTQISGKEKFKKTKGECQLWNLADSIVWFGFFAVLLLVVTLVLLIVW
jgi:hypothetical protein